MAKIDMNGKTVKEKVPGTSAKRAKTGIENITGILQQNMDPKAAGNLGTIMKIVGMF